jgi:hypothetical protein
MEIYQIKTNFNRGSFNLYIKTINGDLVSL